MSNHGDATILARTPYGIVRRCQVGCVHLTFGRVTLHFESMDSLEGLADHVLAIEAERTADEGLAVDYEWLSLMLNDGEARALSELLRRSREGIAWLQGEIKLSDDDVSHLMRGPDGL